MGIGLTGTISKLALRMAAVSLAAALTSTPPLYAQSPAALAPPRCEYGEPHPSAPPELAQFAFLVGDFQVTLHAWSNGTWTPPRPGTSARWNGWYGLGGMAIYDEWYDPDPGVDPAAPRGVNVRTYDAEAEEWRMMWIATGALQVQELHAEMRDGKLTMWQVYPERPAFLADFTVEDADHWYRTSYAPDDNGDWQPQFKLAATRIPCT